MAEHNLLGVKGENYAIEFLQNINYKIIEKNWRFGKDEIDIIATHSNKIIFIEVKTRSNDGIADPEDAVTKKKQKNIVRAADYYINSKNINTEARFDIISIIIDNNKPKFNHIIDAFYPTL